MGTLIGAIFLVRLTRPGVPSAGSYDPKGKGPLKAPIQIVEYSDFQCPACLAAQPILSELRVKQPETIRLLYQHFPLQGHRWSGLAHRAAECAARQNEFWRYHDRLYADQSQWSASLPAPLETFFIYAKEGGLELDLFARCLSDLKVDKKVLEERSVGTRLGVRSTPSFFVNGELVVGTQALREKIEKLKSSPHKSESA